MMYRWHVGYVAWLLNRITGILITFYLCVHIWVLHHIAHGPESYTKVMDFLGSKIFMFFEICIIGCVLYHMMNGIRIVLVDFGGAVKYHKQTFWAVCGLGVVLFTMCTWELFGHFLGLTH
jgi:succinate dehydrogenase cytochrome b subunit